MIPTLFLAQFLGLYLVIVSIAMIVNKSNFKAIILEVSNNRLLIILGGILSLIFGLIIIIGHNVWVGWAILITLIGWCAVIKGIVRLFFTDWCTRYVSRLANNNVYYTCVAIILIIGVILILLGFVWPLTLA